jgi:hypothetical protein
MGLITFDDYVALLLDLVVYVMVLFYIIMDIRKLIAMGRYVCMCAHTGRHTSTARMINTPPTCRDDENIS